MLDCRVSDHVGSQGVTPCRDEGQGQPEPSRVPGLGPGAPGLLRAAVARSCLGASSPPVGKPGAHQSSNLAALQQPAALQTAALEVATPGSCRGMVVVGIFARLTISCTPSGDGFLPNIHGFRSLSAPPVVLFWGHVCLLCGPGELLVKLSLRDCSACIAARRSRL